MTGIMPLRALQPFKGLRDRSVNPLVLTSLALNLYPVIGEQTIAVLFDERAPLLISTNHQSHRGNTHISQNQGRYDR